REALADGVTIGSAFRAGALAFLEIQLRLTDELRIALATEHEGGEAALRWRQIDEPCSGQIERRRRALLVEILGREGAELAFMTHDAVAQRLPALVRRHVRTLRRLRLRHGGRADQRGCYHSGKQVTAHISPLSPTLSALLFAQP